MTANLQRVGGNHVSYRFGKHPHRLGQCYTVGQITKPFMSKETTSSICNRLQDKKMRQVIN